MKTRLFLLLMVIFPTMVRAEGPGESVVKIYATQRGPDLIRPWAKANSIEGSGSGVVIEGKQILTNAHVVLYASEIYVQGKDGGEKFEAKLKAIEPGIDLAVLTLEKEDFFTKRPPLKRSKKMPQERDAVEVYGYPFGGTNQSVTKGIVSRIDFVPYNYQTFGMRVQIDAALNPGNSGGPALAGNTMIGLAFSRFSIGQNIGYIIPNEEIEAFLKDPVAKPKLMSTFQMMQNETLRKKFGLEEKAPGILTITPSGPLQKFDLLTHLGAYEVDSQGQVKAGDNSRYMFQYAVPLVAKEGKVPATVRRDGKEIKMDIPVSRGEDLILPDLKGQFPAFFLYGPLVFSPATLNFARLTPANPESPLFLRHSDKVRFPGEELIVVTSPMMKHKCVRGYSDPAGRVVIEVNKTKIKNLRHLVEVLRDCQDDFVTFGFGGERAEVLSLARKDMAAVTQEVMDDNGIPRRGTAELVELWGQKKKKR